LEGWNFQPTLSEADTPSPTHTYKVPGSAAASRSHWSAKRTGQVGTFQPSNLALGWRGNPAEIMAALDLDAAELLLPFFRRALPAWHDRAACAGQPLDIFVRATGRAAAVLAICDRCEAHQLCASMSRPLRPRPTSRSATTTTNPIDAEPIVGQPAKAKVRKARF
jgi:hypothetical protein